MKVIKAKDIDSKIKRIIYNCKIDNEFIPLSQLPLEQIKTDNDNKDNKFHDRFNIAQAFKFKHKL